MKKTDAPESSVPEMADEVLIAEFQRRAPNLPEELKEKASAALASQTRLRAKGAVGGEGKSAEIGVEAQGLSYYQSQHKRLLGVIKRDHPWETVCARLLANDGEKLKKAKAMQGGGELVGIDADGKILFKDKGVEPVMYGYDKEGKLLQIYDRDSEKMAKVVKWANYLEVRKQVLSDGYELFGDDGNGGLGDEMRQVGTHTKEPLVASKDRNEWRVSWLESGDAPNHAKNLIFNPKDGGFVFVGANESLGSGELNGAVRLLRV
jgi:hypothetical protein